MSSQDQPASSNGTNSDQALRRPLSVTFFLVTLAAACLGFWIMYHWGSPIEIPKELADLPTTAPAEKLAQKEAATTKMLLWNSVISFSLLSAIVGLTIGGFLGSIQTPRKTLQSLVLGGVIFGVSGAVLAIAGWYLRARLGQVPEATISQMMKTLTLHVSVWAILGCIIGLSTAALRGPGTSSSTFSMAGLMGGLLAGCLYSPVAAFAFPMDDTDRLIPTGFLNGLSWSAFSFGLIAALLVGLTKPARSNP